MRKSLLIFLISVFLATAHGKEYLIVGLHAIRGQGQHAHILIKRILQRCKHHNPSLDINQFEVWCPDAPLVDPQDTHKYSWFTDPFQGNLIFSWQTVKSITHIIANYAFDIAPPDLCSNLLHFPESLAYLKQGIEERLAQLELTHDQVIIIGSSQGCITALSLSVQFEKPILAVIGFVGMWVPTSITSVPHHIYLTQGIQDWRFAKMDRLTQQDLQKRLLGRNLTIVPFDCGHIITPDQVEQAALYLCNHVNLSTHSSE